MPDLIAFSWNIQKFSANKLEKNPNLTAQIAKNISDMLKSHSQNPDTPFIGSILEARFKNDELPSLFNKLKDEFARLGIKNVDMEAHETGGATHTSEMIIRISRGVEVKTTPLGFRKQVEAHVNQDILQSVNKFDQHKNVYEKFNLRGDIRKNESLSAHPYAAKSSYFRSSDKGADWYRDGLIYEVQHSQGTGKTIRIATIHAPGPDSKREEIVKKTLTDVMTIYKPDILIGDLNLHKNMTHETYFDLQALVPGGTTLKKNDLEERGTHKWDQAHVKNELKDQVSPLVFSLAKSESIQKLVSDHGMISLIFKDASATIDQTKGVSPFAPTSDTAPLGQPDHPLGVFAGPEARGMEMRPREGSTSFIGPVKGGNNTSGVSSRYFRPY